MVKSSRQKIGIDTFGIDQMELMWNWNGPNGIDVELEWTKWN